MIYLPRNTANVTKDRQDIVIEKVENKKIPKHRKRIITRGFIILPRYYQKATLHIISQTLKRQSVLKHLQTDQSFPLVIKTDNVCTRVTIHVGLFTLEPDLLPPTTPVIKLGVVVKLRNARSDIKTILKKYLNVWFFSLCNLQQDS